MQLTHGGRVTLRLVDDGGASARFSAELETPAARWQGSWAVPPEGPLTPPDLEGPAGRPPGWLVELAAALLRGARRSRAAGGAWPRRITRWRAGEGATPG